MFSLITLINSRFDGILNTRGRRLAEEGGRRREEGGGGRRVAELH
jgi:hypothetical protein